MAKFLLFYKGGDQPTTDEEGQAVMQAWVAWFTSLGAAVVDQGNPFSAGKSVKSDSSVDDSNSGGTGYSVLEAASIDDALSMAKTCPHLSTNGTVEVYETFDVM